MILDISDSNFKKILENELFHLPIRWNGNDFALTLEELFNSYINELEQMPKSKQTMHSSVYVDLERIKKVCGLLVTSVRHYLNGFPSNSYTAFNQVMGILMQNPLKIYGKNATEQFKKPKSYHDDDDDLKLYRVVCVPDNKPYNRERVFHTPYNLRSKVSTCRYSIAGYPSLYLGTSLALCSEEINMDLHQTFALASVFKLERIFEYTNTKIQVIELGVKPQDFIERKQESQYYNRLISRSLLDNINVKSAYMLWYPLIAACSYIRINKKDPFAAEYIIPQLLMQWVRSQLCSCIDGETDQLMGIRYFSCASIKASEMGFNYVFPTSGKQKSSDLPYCSVLAKSFRLSKPVYIHEYDNIYDCQEFLRRDNKFDFI